MRSRMHRRIGQAIVSVVLLIEVLVLTSTTIAAHGPSHESAWTYNEAANVGYHGYNPSHLWIGVYSSNSGGVSSGGQFHDSCTWPGLCSGTFANSQTALDIAQGGGSLSYLYLTYNGYAYGADEPINFSQPMNIYAFAKPVSNYRNPPVTNCETREYDVYVDYWDYSGVYHFRWMGYVWLAHNNNWYNYQQYDGSGGAPYGNPGTWIYPNQWTVSPNGSGTLGYISGIPLGTVSTTFGTCTGGVHTHMEFGSSHNFGAYYEWHGSTELRPGYPGYLQNPDSYNYYPYTPFAHSHKGDDYTGYPAGYDSIGYGTPIGWLGGSSSLYWMLDNPYMAGH